MHNLLCISQARKRQLRVRINDALNSTISGRMELNHKPSDKVKICAFETTNSSYEMVAQVCANETHFCWTEEVGAWHQRLGHVRSEVIQT